MVLGLLQRARERLVGFRETNESVPRRSLLRVRCWKAPLMFGASEASCRALDPYRETPPKRMGAPRVTGQGAGYDSEVYRFLAENGFLNDWDFFYRKSSRKKRSYVSLYDSRCVLLGQWDFRVSSDRSFFSFFLVPKSGFGRGPKLPKLRNLLKKKNVAYPLYRRTRRGSSFEDPSRRSEKIELCCSPTSAGEFHDNNNKINRFWPRMSLPVLP